MTEIQRYRVLDSFSGIELREYEPHTLVTMQTTGSFNQAGYNAFGYLAGYISGQNLENRTIAMTAPVIQKPTNQGYEVSFVLPADLKPNEVPSPASSNLKLQHETGKKVAALRFSGAATGELFTSKGAKLIQVLSGRGLVPKGEVFFARYNGPWTPPFLRRNEALVEIAN